MTKRDLLASPLDRVRHMTINGGVEKGGMDISYQKSDAPNGWLVERGEDGEPKWTRVKWSLTGTLVGKLRDGNDPD